jgi:hypothetical membrane protein
MLTVSIILGSILIAASKDPDFVFFEEWVSELGDGPAQFVFNTGLILGGIFGVVFSFLGLGPVLKRSLSRDIAAIMMGITCVFAVFVGIYPVTYHDEHTIASLGAFISVGIALLFVSYSLGLDNPLGKVVTELTRSVFVLYLILFLFAPNPMGETLSMILLGVWIVVFTVTALRRQMTDETSNPTKGSVGMS